MFADRHTPRTAVRRHAVGTRRARLFAFMVAAGAVTAGARADQIVLPEKNFPAATILGLEDGKLRFQTGTGDIAAYAVDEITWMIVGRQGKHDDFNQAERYLADGKPDAAVQRYRRALRSADGFWSDLIEARLLLALNRTGRLVECVRGFISASQSPTLGSALMARLMPEIPPESGKRDTVQALSELTESIRKAAPGERRTLLVMLRFDFLRAIGDSRADGAAWQIDASALASGARTERVYRVQSAALRILLDGDEPPPEAWTMLDQAIRLCPESMLPEFLMLKGKTMMRGAVTDDDVIRACWAFLRIVAHTPRDPLAADALYEAALAHRRLGRDHRAIALLEECVQHRAVRADTRAKAEALLADLQPTGAPNG